jgi:hypothetical protein
MKAWARKENSFSGTITAMCGTGVPTPGCDGTIYIAPPGQ